MGGGCGGGCDGFHNQDGVGGHGDQIERAGECVCVLSVSLS